VVWDVDVLKKELADMCPHPKQPQVYISLGEVAEAETAVPSWSMPVDNLFV